MLEGTRQRIGRGLEAVRDFLQPPVYTEEYSLEGGPDFQYYVKRNFKNNEPISDPIVTFSHLRKDRYLADHLVPSFAEGRCVIIGGGDYKVVFADRDGKSDRVIKTYSSYPDEEQAQRAAEKIERIHEVARELAPGFILPSEMLVGKVTDRWQDTDRWQVYERQQRALPVRWEIFDPKTVGQLDKEVDWAVFEATDRIKRELLRTGISKKSPYGYDLIDDQLCLTEIHWDLITNHLVSLDFIDRVEL